MIEMRNTLIRTENRTGRPLAEMAKATLSDAGKYDD
jgi:hypothetical protein